MDSFENLLKSATNYIDSGKFSQAIGLYEKALKKAKPKEKAKIKGELAYCYLRSGDLNSALKEAREAEESFARLGDEIELARTRLLLTRVLLEMGRDEEAKDLSMKIYESYKGTAQHKIVGLCQKFIGRAFAQLGDYLRGRKFLQDSLSTFRRADDEMEMLIVYNYLANVDFATSDYKQALVNLKEGLSIAQKRENKRNEALILNNIGMLYRKTGRWAKAEDYLNRSLKIKKKMSDPIHLAHGYISLGRLKALQRDLGGSEELLKKSLALSQAHSYERAEAMSLESLADVAKERGDLGLARDCYQRTLDIGRRLGQKDLINQVQRRRAELFLAEGKGLDEASECVQEALRISQSLGDKFEEGCCYRVQALIFEAQGNLDGAKESFQKAVRVLESIEDRFELGRTLLEQGRFTASALKERERGLELLQEADRLFSDMGPGCGHYRGLAKLEMARVELLFSHSDEVLNFIAEAETLLGEKEALKVTARLRSQVESRLDSATDSEENPYLLLKELSFKPTSEAGLRNHLKSLLHTIAERVGADQGFVAYRETDGLKVAERVKLREEEAEKVLHLLATNSFEPGRLTVKLSADGKFSSLKVGALLVMPLGLKERLDGILYLAQKPDRGGWRQEDVQFFVAASEHIHRVVDELRVEGLEAENLVLKAYQIADSYGFSRLITDDKKMKEVLRVVEKIKDALEGVLLTGKSGTGKELIAKLIHYSSQRALGPFVTVDCASITESLLEDELFGHIKGAFTGATQERRGKFEEANGGSIFLDEISTLKPDLQVKLLRILEEGEMQRRGDNRWRKVDVRVIAATNKDLQAEVNAGRFREDVFYRLNCFPIELPPLRQRKGDMPLLVNYFLERFNRENHHKKIMTPEAMEKLMEYDFPGNVREVKNLIRRAVTLADGDIITPSLVEIGKKRASVLPPKGGSLPEKIALMEREECLTALEKSNWKITEAANMLGVPRTTLHNKMKKLNIYTEGE